MAGSSPLGGQLADLAEDQREARVVAGRPRELQAFVVEHVSRRRVVPTPGPCGRAAAARRPLRPRRPTLGRSSGSPRGDAVPRGDRPRTALHPPGSPGSPRPDRGRPFSRPIVRLSSSKGGGEASAYCPPLPVPFPEPVEGADQTLRVGQLSMSGEAGQIVSLRTVRLSLVFREVCP